MNGPWRNRSASDQSPGTCSPPACDDWRFRPRTSSRTRARAGPRFRSGRPPRPAGDRRDRPGAPEPLFETAHSHFESGKEVVDALDPVEAGSHQVGFRQGRVLDGGREPGVHRGTAPRSLKKASPDCAAGRGSEDAFGTPAHDAMAVRRTVGHVDLITGEPRVAVGKMTTGGRTNLALRNHHPAPARWRGESLSGSRRWWGVSDMGQFVPVMYQV